MRTDLTSTRKSLTMSEHYDLIVLGAGPGGYVAAIRAAQLGLRTAVVEEKYWGGVCLNVGCIPSKALLRNAELAHIFHTQAKTFGITGEVSFDFGAAFDRSRTVADGRVKGVHYLMKKNKIAEYDGLGTFRDANTLDVALSTGGSQTLTFDNAIIATGSTVRLLPGVELSDNVVTYETQILDRDLPESIVIVGAGAIGMEFGYVLKNYGVDVTIVEYLDRALPNEDADVSKEITKQYRKLGIPIVTSAKVETVTDKGSSVVVSYTRNGKTETIEAARVLMSVGFAPRVEGFGLENTGVKLTDRGAIEIDDHMRTNIPHLYAIGDVTSKLQLAHVAEAQGVVASETIGGAETMTLGDYRMMPRATFCQPQVASFGLTEQQARDEGYDVKVSTFPFTANGKAHGLAEPTGFVKLVADAKYNELLGGHLIGPDVSELLPELTLAQKWDLTANELARNVHTHPTLSEALQEAFHGLTGHMINL
ncbi:dihydrolipoyl dehydrogenase [Amorphoplanes digitatis]|nr:dihydrolipoyl dehydrogenase [Actinoplanes digitatis]